MSDNQESAVISEVLDGKPDQYRFLVERYHRGLILHLYNLTNDQQTSEDIAQEAFIKAYEKLSQYNSDYAFSTWLYKIADNLAYRHLSQLKASKDIDEIAELLPDDKPSLAEQTDRQFESQSVREAVDRLPVAYRQVIGLYYWDNFSYEEIADVIEKPIGTVRTWLHRAKEELRKELYGQVG